MSRKAKELSIFFDNDNDDYDNGSWSQTSEPWGKGAATVIVVGNSNIYGVRRESNG